MIFSVSLTILRRKNLIPTVHLTEAYPLIPHSRKSMTSSVSLTRLRQMKDRTADMIPGRPDGILRNLKMIFRRQVFLTETV